MKKTIKITVQALPFIAMTIILIHAILNLISPIIYYNFQTDNTLKYLPLSISKETIFRVLMLGLKWFTYLIGNTIYVFCAVLGIGSIKNKWIRMLFLFMPALLIVVSNHFTAHMFVIITILLFSEQTGIKHALRSSLIFAVMYFILAMRETSGGLLMAVGIDNMLFIYAVQCVTAVIIGIIGAVLLLKIRNKTVGRDEIRNGYKLANVYTVIAFILAVILMAVTIKNADGEVSLNLSYMSVIKCVYAVLIVLLAVCLSAVLACSMKSKAVFIISCVILALSFDSIVYIYTRIKFSDIMYVVCLVSYYMLLIAVIAGSFDKGRDYKGNIPALSAMIIPVLYKLSSRNIISYIMVNNVSQGFDTSVYQYGRAGVSNAEAVVKIVGFILVCLGIAMATAMIKNDGNDINADYINNEIN